MISTINDQLTIHSTNVRAFSHVTRGGVFRGNKFPRQLRKYEINVFVNYTLNILC
jgi:hypothetical protein